jgi:hypothetical protein
MPSFCHLLDEVMTIDVKLDSALFEIQRGVQFLGTKGFETLLELYEIFKTMLAKR